MSSKTVRVFVGNLPSDTTEDDLKDLMKKYAIVLTVEIKRRVNDVFAFVDLKDLKTNLDTCFQGLSRKKWRGQQLKVQLARESFLQRLARERQENKNVVIKEENVSLKTQHDVNYVNQCPDLINENVKGNCQKINGNNDPLSTDSTDGNDAMEGSNDDMEDSDNDSSDSETPMKGSLKMFCGTASVFQKEMKPEQKMSKLNFNKISTNKIHEEREILEKFEMFDGVWKDEPSESATQKTKNHTETSSKKQKLRHASPNRKAEMQENIAEITISQIKQAEAEERRLRAIADRNKEILNKKHAIQFALASVDSCSKINRPNKKIIFTDNDYSNEKESTNCFSSGVPKLTLFSDDEMDQEMDNKNDFRIRKHYEGEKGQSLLSLQAQYANDKRFTLDERFIDSDDEQKIENEVEKNDTEAEREKFLRILGNVLGKEIPDSNKTKTKHSTKLMLRYDPSKPDHTKFEIKKESTPQNLKRKKTEDEKSVPSNEVANSKEVADNLPVVSKERYYQVSETLRETLENKDQKFSLSAIFGDENENEKVDVNLEAKPIIGRKEWPLKPFQNDSSASEDETNDQNVAADHSREHNIGVKQESLFFEKNDARFVEGLEFIKFTNEEYMQNFDKIRCHVRSIIKHKVQNYKKNSERWRTKFGGRMKNTLISSSRRLKSNFRR